MRLSQLRSLWSWVWLLFAAFAGLGTFASRFLPFDPFLAERYLSILLCVPFLAILVVRHGIVVRKSDAAAICGAGLTLFIALSSSPEYLAPLGFFFFAVVLLFSTQELSPSITELQIARIRVLFLGLLGLLSSLWIVGDASSFQLGDRFVGFFASPTTFSTWITALLLVAYSQSAGHQGSKGARIAYFVALIATTLLIYASGTRTNLVFIALLVFSEFFRPLLSKRFIRFALIAGAAVAVGIAYPVYEVLSQVLPDGVLAYRYGGGLDASAGLRIALFDAVFQNYLTNEWPALMFGSGAGSSRLVVQTAFGADLLPHNDIVRLLHDFGIVTLVIFVAGLATIGSRTYISTILTLLYVVSFVHNMVYSHYLIALIALAAGSNAASLIQARR